MFLGFDAIGMAALSEEPEDRFVGGGTSEGGVDWEVIIYTASHEIVTRLADAPSNQAFKGTLEKAFRFDRSIIGDKRIGEQVTIGLGEMRLSNLEQDYDFLAIDHTPLGQRVTVKRGNRRKPYATWQTMLEGYLTGQEIDRDTITFRLRDAGHLLDVPASPNAYAGSGGAEGGDDLKDKRKPRGFGHVPNATPALVVPATLIYQLNDGPIEAVDAVYDRGVELTAGSDYASYALLAAASTASAHYDTCLAAGLIKLGSSPSGTVTADFQGDKTGGTFVETAPDIVERLLTSAAGLAAGDLAAASFAALAAAQDAPVGYYIPAGDEQTVADAAGRVMAGIGGWCGPTRRGKFEVRRLDAPAGAVSGSYDRTGIVDVKVQPLPQELQPPPWRVRVGYARNVTVQTDLAGTVSAARKAFLADELRFASDEDAGIRADFPPGHELIVDNSYFRDEADALAEATRRLALWGAPRALYVIALAKPHAHELGQVIDVDFPRFDLDGGKLLRIVKIVEDDADGTELMAFG